jgi:hypothetical protein
MLPSDASTEFGGALASFLEHVGLLMGAADWVAGEVALVVPEGVAPPGIMNGKSEAISGTSVGMGSLSVTRVQVDQTLQVEVLELVEVVVVEVVLWSGLLSSTEEGLPSDPIVSGGYPGGGGIMPPGITPAPGITMMPIPGPTYQIGKIVLCPSAVVVVTEFVVRPAMLCVVVENGPLSVDVCGPGVIGPLSEFVVVVAADGPPLSVDSNGLFG